MGGLTAKSEVPCCPSPDVRLLERSFGFKV